MTRPTWKQYFMGLAKHAATRATCDRKHVGAVLVRHNEVLATGYNGSIAGQPHCDDAGHLMEDGHCVRTVHAEANALASAAKRGISVEGSDCHVTAFPCWACFKLLANAGIERVFYGEEYRISQHVRAAAEHVDENGRIVWLRRNTPRS